MPVLIVAVIFFLVFLVMGVLGFSATSAGHEGGTFSAGGTQMDFNKPGRSRKP